MFYFEFSHDIVVEGVPIAEISGEARIVANSGSVDWRIDTIRIDALRGRGRIELHRDSELRRSREIFTEIVLWLYENHCSDIDAEWREYLTRQVRKAEVVA
jgi:hypothetical protein